MFGKETYYQSIREYMPQDAQAALDRQIPVIRQQIESEVAAFGQSLAQHVRTEVEAQIALEQKELADGLGRIRTTLASITAAVDPAKVEALKAEIDAFETRYKGLGEKIRSTVKSSLAQAIPGLGAILP